MELPNIHFQDFPIEFKEINPIDFKTSNILDESLVTFQIKNNEKTIIEPNEKGFINDVLQPEIILEEKNTVVINAPVGSGKSHAIIKTIKRFYSCKEKYLIVVATPFVSLVEQYVNDIHKDADIPENEIYNYLNLGRNTNISYINKSVQVVTVNTLLGNPGEDGFKNSEVKREYLNGLITHCKLNQIKVVFVFDEIHDAIQNFKEELFFNLLKWKDVVHKNFIISATFNEASKVVIEYLAELTDRKIQIIESRRKRFPKKQSDLYLHYSSEHNFSETTNEIVRVINDLVERDKNIDILCYSKSLVKDIAKDKKGVGKLLTDKFGRLNDCTSELVSNQRTQNEAPKNRYDESKCNIGTNFKTGVSIRKSNHAFVIILPPRATRLWFRNKSGIFSDGINSVIQAIARQRKKGEIHIILPRPDVFDYSSLVHAGMNEMQIEAFKRIYEQVKHYDDSEIVKYYPLILQDLLLKDFYYSVLEENVKDEIDYVNSSNRNGLNRLDFPPYSIFKLDRGEEYLANTIKFFGEDLSAYVTYCAFTNQFVNCNLVKVNYKTDLFFEENKIQKGLNRYFDQFFKEDYLYSLIDKSDFNMAYNDFRNELFSNFSIRFKKSNSTKWVKISPFSCRPFEIQLLRFIAFKYYSKEYFYNSDFTDSRSKDEDYSRGIYFMDSIKCTESIAEEVLSEKERNKFRLFQIISHFRNKLLSNKKSYISATLSYEYFNNKPPREFFNEEDQRLLRELISLIQYDELLSNEVFEFKRDLGLKQLYTKLMDDFFIVVPDKIPTGRRENIKRIIDVKPMPSNNKVINLLQPLSYLDFELTTENEAKYDEVIKQLYQILQD